MSAQLASRLVQVRTALMRGDHAAVDAFLIELDEQTLPLELRSPVVELLIARNQWSRAAAIYQTIAQPPPRLQMQQVFLRNMAVLEQHRPTLAKLVEAAKDGSPWVLDGNGRIGQRDSGGLFVPIHPEPEVRLRRDLEAALEALRNFRPFLYLGIGDGYSLAELALRDLQLPHGMQQIFLIVEPDAGLLRSVLSLHDLSGPLSILAHSRAHWFVGEDWEAQFRRELITQATISLPDVAIMHPVEPRAVASMHAIRDDYVQELISQFQANKAWLQARSREEMELPFSPTPSRVPRVMFLTSRFTAVLQYSTERCAAAFRSLGWQTHVLVEDRDDLRCTSLGIARTITQFRPDLVLVLNHLRREHGSLFPAELPYITWVQDSMPALQNHEAGASVGPREVVMTGLSSFTRVYGYPPAQIFRCQCLAHERVIGDLSGVPHHDLVYLSHASMSVESLRARVQSTAAHYKLPWTRVEPFFDELLAHYRADRSFSAMDEWGASIRSRIGLADDDYEQGHPWTETFSFAYCTLHRQQGLRWALKYAQERDLDAAVYGNGWSELPEFARFARGAVKPGEQADAIVAAAKINLCLEPWPITAHWRGLDCMILGGFFLARAHDYHQALQELVNFLAMHGYGGHFRGHASDATPGLAVWNEADAWREVPPGLHYRLSELIYMSSKLGLLGDALDTARSLGLRVGEQKITPPRIDEVAFSTAEQLQQKLDYFLQQPEKRREIAEHFSRFVREELTYGEGMKRVLAFMGQRIAADLTKSASPSATRPSRRAA